MKSQRVTYERNSDAMVAYCDAKLAANKDAS